MLSFYYARYISLTPLNQSCVVILLCQIHIFLTPLNQSCVVISTAERRHMCYDIKSRDHATQSAEGEDSHKYDVL